MSTNANVNKMVMVGNRFVASFKDGAVEMTKDMKKAATFGRNDAQKTAAVIRSLPEHMGAVIEVVEVKE